MTDRRPLWLRTASTVYRVCSLLMPRGVRERFGPESQSSFDRLIEDTLRQRGPRAALTMVAAACGDVARAGASDRLPDWSGFAAGTPTDIAHSLRRFWREPILSVALMLTLAIVSGPTVATFNALYHLVLAPLPYPDPGRLVVVSQQTPNGTFHYLPTASVADYRNVKAFSTVGGIFPVGSVVGSDADAVRVQSCRATAGLLSSLGVPFVAGRDLVRGERGIVVTRGFALSRFGGEQAAIGQTVVLNRELIPVVGVVEYSPPLPGPPGIQLFYPHVSADLPEPSRQRGGQAIVIARLADENRRVEAVEQAKAVAADVRARFGGAPMTIALTPLDVAVSGAVRVPLLILFATVAAVFLVAVTSLASLVLARAASRAGEVAVRRSLGASAWRLVRSWLIDGVVLAIPGTLLGASFGAMLLRYAKATLPTGLVPLPDNSGLLPMAAVSVFLATATAMLFAFAPIVAGLLRTSSGSMTATTAAVAGLRRMRSQSILVVGQVALSLALVAAASLLSASLWRTLSRPVGFDPASLVAIWTQSTISAFSSVQERDVMRQVLARLEALEPGAGDRVAVASSLPGVNANRFGPTRIYPGQPAFTEEEQPTLSRSAVSQNYFRVLGIPLLEGRYFTTADEAAPDRVTIVSRSFAARWFPNGAMGQVVSFGRKDRREIIGIVEDVHSGRLSEESIPQFYVPMTDIELGAPSSYVIRTPRRLEAVRADATAILREADPRASLVVATVRDAMAMPLVLQTTVNRLTLAMAALALLLAVVNVYALSAFAVVQRTREIGIRIALGARAADAMRLVMRRGLVWTGVGLALGMALTAFVVAPLLQRQLFATSVTDPALLIGAVLLVSLAAGLAAWLPARRAAAIDPAITLRAE